MMRLTIVAGVMAGSMAAVHAGQEQSQPAAPDHARALVARLDLTRYKATVAGLAAFGDRREGTARNRNAVDWIEAQLKSYGCETARMSYDPANPTGEPPAPPSARADGRRANAPVPRTPAGTADDPFRRGAGNKGFGARTGVNRDPMAQPDATLRAINEGPVIPGPVEQVYCTKRGTTRPGEMYILGAHMDGIGYGAAVNDDASGTAIVMELARILNAPGVATDVSIRFALWNGEEGGLKGARAYVAQRRERQGSADEPRWLGMIQHDMMMFDHGMPNPDGTLRTEQRREADVNVEFQENSKMAAESQKLAWFFRNANEKYATDYPASVGNHMQSTDSVPFQDLIPSISLRENERRDHVGFGWNPHWHQPTDVMASYSDDDFRLGLNAAQTTLAAIAQLAKAVVSPGDWPQWRGPGGAGQAEGVFKDTWTPETVAWKVAIPGRGHSSPVVANGRIYLTTAVEGGPAPEGHKAPVHLGFDLQPGYVNPDSCCIDRTYALKVLALDAKTGALLWERTAFDGAMYDDRHRKNTYASSTVTTDGETLYAYFEAAGLYAYDKDGTQKWKADFGGLAKAGMGPGMSPLMHGDLLFVQNDLGMGDGSHIVALDRATGKEIWKTARSHRRSWATPIIVTADGREELIASGAESVIAYDPMTGAELWRTGGVRSHPIPSAVQGHGLIFATAGSGAKVALAIRPGEVDPAERLAWTHNKGTAYVASPILYGDYLYLISDAGLMTCLDAKTGEVKYEGGRPPVPATFRASPVAFGGKLLVTSEEGDTFVIKAGPVHEVIRTNSVDEPVWASPALANGTIYIRGANHLFAIR